MQQYQNYFQNQNPYQQNPYMNNYQQTMVGRVVDDFSTINASDVPMNGQPATFIKRDLSEVQLRFWNGNGQIEISQFKPIENVTPNNSTLNELESENGGKMELTDLFENKFAELNSRFDKLEKKLTPKSTSKTKKEVVADE